METPVCTYSLLYFSFQIDHLLAILTTARSVHCSPAEKVTLLVVLVVVVLVQQSSSFYHKL